MAKVSLRVYNREIESLIDHGQVEEAIAHCRHILQSYPKHIETYRLLGKAFLESRRYGEASDIFQRVISSIPDDFVSQVGMSMIKEDEGNLDGAIWHMERAFEVQPSNSAVQDELRRLFQRRDGIELTRIRLTRGALARMYAKGNLYQQAIAEIRSTLVSEPVRPDLQVLLAQMCYQAGQRIESTEICSELLSKFPYCLEANRILTQILPNTTRADDAKVYLQRIYALDPYAAFATPTDSNSQNIPDNVVTIERLDYRPGTKNEAEQPEWASSLGLNISDTEPATESIPDWLSNLDSSATSESGLEAKKPVAVKEDLLTPTDNNENLIPDWMKSAGWTESLGEAVETPSETSQMTDEFEAEAVPAEIPPWLKNFAPEPLEQKTSAPEEILSSAVQSVENEDSTVEELPDWLKSIDGAGSAEEPSSVVVPEATYEEKAPPVSQEIPAWLQALKGNAPLEPESTANLIPPVGDVAGETPPQSTGAGIIPDLLKGFEAESNPPEVKVDQAAEMVEPNPAVPTIMQETPAQPSDEIPDWLQELSNTHPPETTPEQPEPVMAQMVEETSEIVLPETDTASLSTTITGQDLTVKKSVDEEIENIIKREEISEMPADLPPQVIFEKAPMSESTQSAIETTSVAPEEPMLVEPELTPTEVISHEVVTVDLPSLEHHDPVLTAELGELHEWLKTPETESTTADLPTEQTVGPLTPEHHDPVLTAELGELPDWLKTPEAESTSTELPSQQGIEPVAPEHHDPVLTAELGEHPDGFKTSESESTNTELPSEQTVESVAPEHHDPVLTAELGELPDWLKTPEAESATTELPTDQTVEPEAPEHHDPVLTAGLGELPEWLKTSEDVSNPTEIPSIRFGEINEQEPLTSTEMQESPAEPAVDIPEWLQNFANPPIETLPEETEPLAPQTAVEVPESAQTEAGTDTGFAWLESLAAKQTVDEGSLITNPEELVESPPQEIQPVPVEEATISEPTEETPEFTLPIFEELAQPTETIPPLAESFDISARVPHDPVNTATLGELPDWLKEIQAESGTVELMPDQTTEKEGKQEPPSEIPEPRALPATDIPEWLQELGNTPRLSTFSDEVEQVAPQAPELSPESPLSDADQDGGFAWLEGLAAKQGADEETLYNEPEARIETPPDWIQRETSEEDLEPESAPPETEIGSLEPEEAILKGKAFPYLPSELPSSNQKAEDLPEWLRELEFSPDKESISPDDNLQPEADLTTLRSFEIEKVSPEAAKELPGWLMGIDESKNTESVETADVSSNWQQSEEQPPISGLEGTPFPFPGSELPAVDQTIASPPVLQPAVKQEISTEGVDYSKILQESQDAFGNAKVEQAVLGYRQLVNGGVLVEETIHDLRDALYRFPVDVTIWQVLGDAYVRSNRIQDALDAYTKAEELMR